MPSPALPTKIKIIGKTYAVESVPEMDDCGLCYDTKQLIKISEELPHELTQDTLLHEVMHAIDYQMHIGLKEREISAMASGITAVIKENPVLAKFLLTQKKTDGATAKAAPTKHKSRKRLTK